MTAVTETRPGHSSHSTNATYRQQRGTAAKGAGANEEHIRPRAGRWGSGWSRPALLVQHEQASQRRRRVLPAGDVLTSGGSRTERARLSGRVLAYLVGRTGHGVSVVRSRGAVAAVRVVGAGGCVVDLGEGCSGSLGSLGCRALTGGDVFCDPFGGTCCVLLDLEVPEPQHCPAGVCGRIGCGRCFVWSSCPGGCAGGRVAICLGGRAGSFRWRWRPRSGGVPAQRRGGCCRVVAVRSGVAVVCRVWPCGSRRGVRCGCRWGWCFYD